MNNPVQFGKVKWAATCMLAVIPSAAILHNALFYRSTCMLNPFGPEYDAGTLRLWLFRDPSLPWAMVASLLAYQVARVIPMVRKAVSAYFVSFLALSVWIWDIPFTHRSVCRNFHDGRLLLAPGVPLLSRYLYYFGLACWILLMIWFRPFRRANAWRKVSAAER